MFTLRNTGTPANIDPALHPSDAAPYLNSDVYRLSLSVEGDGWSAQLLNGLTAVEIGGNKIITVHVFRKEESSGTASVVLQATSESDPSKSATARVRISR